MRLRYSGTDPIIAPVEIVAANPGVSSTLSAGMEREVPDAMAKKLLEQPYWSKVKAEKGAK